MWSRLSLKTKLTALVVIIVAVASWAFAKVAFSGLVGLFDKVTGLRALTVAEALATNIDTDWLTSTQAAGGSGPIFAELQSRFDGLIRLGRVNRIVVVRLIDKAQIEYVLSVPADTSGDYKVPGTVQQLQAGDVFRERSPGYGTVQSAAPGFYMGGWAPVYRGGEPIGLVLVAVDINETQTALNTAYLIIICTLLAFTLLSGLVAYKFSASFEKTAVTDGLMGIYNHKYFKQRLEEETAKARRYRQQTALVLLDIDFFKRVNDTYGHATGDIVLKCLARWVTEGMRNTDVVARYGGEEIAIILPHTSLAGAQEFAERLRINISQQVVRDPEEKAEFRVTVSVGVAQWEDGMTSMDMIKRADAALYHSKHMGRNRVTIYQEEILPPPDSQAGAKS